MQVYFKASFLLKSFSFCELCPTDCLGSTIFAPIKVDLIGNIAVSSV